MKTRAAFLVFLLFGATRLTAQAPILTPLDALAFDYLDSDYTNYQVNGFQAQWDGGSWVALSPASFRDAQTMNGATSYKVIPPFTNGSHSVSYRACNAVGCGGGSAPFPFAFAVVEAPLTVPGNVRVVRR